MVSPRLAALPDEVLAKIAPVSFASEQLLPLADPLAGIVPWAGLQRGTSVSIQGATGLGTTSLALSLLAEATQSGSWAAIVGMPSCGLAAASELGVAPERLAVIDRPDPQVWASVVGALLGSFDLVMVSPRHKLRPADQRRLMSRARERGTVVLSVHAEPVGTTDLAFTITRASWNGLGNGHGYLQSRDVEVQVEGRRQASRPRTVLLRLPGPSGRVEAISDLEETTLEKTTLGDAARHAALQTGVPVGVEDAVQEVVPFRAVRVADLPQRRT